MLVEPKWRTYYQLSLRLFWYCAALGIHWLFLQQFGSHVYCTDVVVAPLVACLHNKKNYTFEFATLVYHECQMSSFLIEYKYVVFLSTVWGGGVT